MLPTKFRVGWHFGSGEEAKTGVQDGGHCGHLGFPIGMILAIFSSPELCTCRAYVVTQSLAPASMFKFSKVCIGF